MKNLGTKCLGFMKIDSAEIQRIKKSVFMAYAKMMA